MTRHLAVSLLPPLAVVLVAWLTFTPAVWAADPAGASASAPAAAPQGNAAPNPSGGAQGFLPDPTQWAESVFSQVVVSMLQSFTDAVGSLVNNVMGSSLNFISQTPAQGSYASPTVTGLWATVRNIANAALVLVVLWSGYSVMVRDQIGAQYQGVMELLPRIGLAALLVNTSLSWAQLVIDVNNALCGVIGQTSLPAWQSAGGPSQALANVVAGLIYVVVSLLLLIQMLMRLALIDVMLVVAPAALLCWALPQTQAWARLWSATFTATVFVQFVQVLAMKLGASLITELAGIPVDAHLLSIFLGIGVLALTLKLPGLMRAHMGDGLGFPRYLAYHEGARAFDRRSGAAGGSGSGGGSGASASGAGAAGGASAAKAAAVVAV